MGILGERRSTPENLPYLCGVERLPDGVLHVAVLDLSELHPTAPIKPAPE
jgi:hypothetical protein